MRIVDDQAIEVVQPLADQDRDDVGLGDRGIVGPAKHLHGVGGEAAAQLEGITARHYELSELDDHGDTLRCRLGGRGRFRRTTPERLEVDRAKQVAVDQFQGGSGFAEERGEVPFTAERLFEPRTPIFSTARRPYAAAAVVTQNDVVGREHHLIEERRQRQQLPAMRHDVEDVAVDEELGGGP